MIGLKESFTIDIIPKPDSASNQDSPLFCWKNHIIDYEEDEDIKSSHSTSSIKKSFSTNSGFAVAWGNSVQVKSITPIKKDAKHNFILSAKPIMGFDVPEGVLSLGWLENKVIF